MQKTAFGLALLGFISAAASAHAAGINDAVEASQESLNHHGQREGIKRWLSLSFSENFQGPGVNNLDGHLTTTPAPNSAPTQSDLRQTGGGGGHGHGHGHARGGAHKNDQSPAGTATSTASSGGGSSSSGPTVQGPSLRHSISAGFHFNDTFTLGPVFEMSEKLYGPTSGNLRWNDPQLRFTMSNIIKAPIGPHFFSTSVWFSAAAPISDQSKNARTVTAVGVSVLPRLRFAHSDFSLSGMASAKPTLVQADQGDGLLYPTKLFAGIQLNYRISRVVTVYEMNYISGTIGPQIATPDADLTADASHGAGAARKIGLMPGMSIRATDFISISPRMNWNYGQPIQTTTVGVNANIIMI